MLILRKHLLIIFKKSLSDETLEFMFYPLLLFKLYVHFMRFSCFFRKLKIINIIF